MLQQNPREIYLMWMLAIRAIFYAVGMAHEYATKN